jgi:hypothetical protein
MGILHGQAGGEIGTDSADNFDGAGMPPKPSEIF